ncbi:tRNA-modifying protein YgfZ [Candidatus Enterovibrio altilux]|uniref:Folate-dependent protein for Fe/S cluster synthesis n=1 Tax=Candidatus Enterovibrio altilux TaxID=1927128 RepID=A0A291B6L4_9GAMM|nr:tRNA-modifying protein YgfZ [Candidatus Enterovibrio luxaltus]ATF08628.1 Folate-dependent protein for Fe/S cluster synthesis [Candidatus Enterovibrio luxaltus]
MTNWYQTHDFSRLPLFSNSILPALSVIALDNTTLITVKGDDAISYLQGQLTCDLVSLNRHFSTLAAHCDAKGKVWSVLRLFHHLECIAYTQPTAIAEKQLIELKKYAIFSKINFEISTLILLGIAGAKADDTMLSRDIGNNNVCATQTGTAVRIEPNRWLLAMETFEADSLLNELTERATLSDSSLWNLLELRAAIPSLTYDTTNKFIPQSLNLQALNAINFKKGCYIGQETVARAKYRGVNNRATYLMQGYTDTLLEAGDVMERRVGKSWRPGGIILSGYPFDDGQALALVVISNNLGDDTEFRLANTTAIWQKLPLPYSLEDA